MASPSDYSSTKSRDRSRSNIRSGWSTNRSLSASHRLPGDDYVNPSLDPANSKPCKSLRVFRLNLKTTEEQLSRVFAPFGLLGGVYIGRNSKSNRSRGFGVVNYSSIQSAVAARDAMNGTDLDGFKIRVEFADRTTGRNRIQGANSRPGQPVHLRTTGKCRQSSGAASGPPKGQRRGAAKVPRLGVALLIPRLRRERVQSSSQESLQLFITEKAA